MDVSFCYFYDISEYFIFIFKLSNAQIAIDISRKLSPLNVKPYFLGKIIYTVNLLYWYWKKKKKKKKKDFFSSNVVADIFTKQAKYYERFSLFSLFFFFFFFFHNITKTRLYNFDPLKPHFYIVKLGFAGVNIIFSYFCSKT